MPRVIFVPLFALALVSAGLLWYLSASGSHAATGTEASLPTATEPFTDTFRHFTLAYPKGDAVHVIVDSEVARTFTFESADNPAHSFQIYVQTYGQSAITAAQFRTDDPSGVMDDVSTTTIDGVPAKTFVGYNDQMGMTNEIWFIHGGFLYEVTTYQSSAAWLRDILRTWRFI